MKLQTLSFLMSILSGASAFAGGKCYVQNEYGSNQYHITVENVLVTEASGPRTFSSADGQFSLEVKKLTDSAYNATLYYQGEYILESVGIVAAPQGISPFLWNRSHAKLPNGNKVTLWCTASSRN